jgi:Ca2+/Na+ antiporter
MILQIAQRIGIPFALLVMAALYFLEVREGKVQDLMLIRPVFYMMVVLFCINAATDLRDILRSRQEQEAADEKEKDSLKTILAFAGLAILLVAAMPFAGFLIASAVFICLVLLLFKVESKTVLFTMPVCVALALYALFEFVFGVELPAGFLGF